MGMSLLTQVETPEGMQMIATTDADETAIERDLREKRDVKLNIIIMLSFQKNLKKYLNAVLILKRRGFQNSQKKTR